MTSMDLTGRVAVVTGFESEVTDPRGQQRAEVG